MLLYKMQLSYLKPIHNLRTINYGTNATTLEADKSENVRRPCISKVKSGITTNNTRDQRKWFHFIGLMLLH